MEVVFYEHDLAERTFLGFEVVGDVEKFKLRADVIIPNLRAADLADVEKKACTCDIYRHG